MTDDLKLDLTPDGPKLWDYLRDEADVVLIQGHRASLKSSTSCDKLLTNAVQQPFLPAALQKAKGFKAGIRYRRTYVLRQTFDELERTTVKTWLTKFPEDRYGALRRSKPPVHHIRILDLDWEVIFLALDREEEAKKLLSSEASDAWINEFREMPRRVIEDLGAVVGRYPDPKSPFRPQIIGDTNAPPSHHWFSVASGQAPLPDNLSESERVQFVMPKGWSHHIQPPAMFEVVGGDGEASEYRHNPEREGRKHVADAYFDRLVLGRTKSWIRVNVLNKPAMLVDGDPVFPGYKEEVHKAGKILEPLQGHPIMVGVDFGRTPAAVLGQRVFDRWRILKELCAEGIGAKVFAGLLKRALSEWFPGYPVVLYGDPAGEQLSQSDENSPFILFGAAGLPVFPAPSNDPPIRLGAVEEVLRSAPDGVPRLQVSPNCVRLNAAMAGDYHYPRVRGTGREQTMPLKNRASHIADALQYLLLGAGEGWALMKPAVTIKVQPKRRERGWSRLRAFAGR